MKIKNNLLLFFLVVAGIGVGCKDSIVNAPSVLFGDITGIVRLRDSLGNVLKNSSGVNISFEGTNFSGVTDSNGVWTIHDVSTGNYTIVYQKKHFADEKNINHQFVGNGSDFIGTEDMYALLNINMIFALKAFENDIYTRSYDSTYLDSNGIIQTILVTDTISFYPNSKTAFGFYVYPAILNDYRTIAVVYGRDSNVSILHPDSYKKIDLNIETANTDFGDTTKSSFWENLWKRNFISLGFLAGDKIYCRGYIGGKYAMQSRYLDIKTGQPIYTAFNNASPVKSFILP